MIGNRCDWYWNEVGGDLKNDSAVKYIGVECLLCFATRVQFNMSKRRKMSRVKGYAWLNYQRDLKEINPMFRMNAILSHTQRECQLKETSQISNMVEEEKKTLQT